MGWIISLVALSLVMTILTIADLRLPTKMVALGERVIALFVAVTFAGGFIYGLALLAARIWL